MVGIINYNMGNIKSVGNAIEFLGTPIKYIKNQDDFTNTTHIILPGVGAFGKGIENLRKQNLIPKLENEVFNKKKPFLGICLGMQLICRESFEFGHYKGLGWIDASVRKFEGNLNVRIPHVGWNNLIVNNHNNSLIDYNNQDIDVYFVHSFYVDVNDNSVVAATCEYGRMFAAQIEKGNIFATQFHPEKSQNVGLNILNKFLKVDK